MSFPTPVGHIVADMDVPGIDRFPFFWWAAGAKFKYANDARHLFCKLGSAAEAFFFREFVERRGVSYTPESAILGTIEVIPQKIVAKYRLDFAVHDGDTRIAVEVDGAQFHQRTETQVEGDYLRARRIIAAGYTVVRYTAVEAFRDPKEYWRQLDAILVSRNSRPRRSA